MADRSRHDDQRRGQPAECAEPPLTEARVRAIVTEMFQAFGLRDQLGAIHSKLDRLETKADMVGCNTETLMAFAQDMTQRLKTLNTKVDALVASEVQQDAVLVSIAADVTALKEKIINADSPEDVNAAQAEATALEQKVDAAVTASEAQTVKAQEIDDLVPPATPQP